MPPTFLLVGLLLVVAMFAPLVLLLTPALALWPRTRRTGLRALSAGAAGSAALMAVFFVLCVFVDTETLAGLLVFVCALGFNAGVGWCVIASVRRHVRATAPATHARLDDGGAAR